MLKTVIELEMFSVEELKELLIVASKWLEFTPEQQYHSKLYKLTSDLNEVYHNDITVYQTVDLVAIEVARRVTDKLIATKK